MSYSDDTRKNRYGSASGSPTNVRTRGTSPIKIFNTSGESRSWKIQKRAEAEARQAERDKRSNAEQLLLLDLRLGEGVGARRERARLN